MARGKPYKEFLESYVQPEPPKDLLYYGSWGDDTDELTATHFTSDGPERVKATVDKLPLIMLPDRREVKISQLEDRIRELEQKHGEVIQRRS
jgi:acetone carboxylase alpha subunit